MHQTALTRRGRKQVPHSSQQTIMPVSHDKVELAGSSRSQVLQQGQPALFVFLSAGS
jgi:hypothetical protein